VIISENSTIVEQGSNDKDEYWIDPNKDYFKRGLVFCAIMLILMLLAGYWLELIAKEGIK
jgi:hypothetical protein